MIMGVTRGILIWMSCSIEVALCYWGLYCGWLEWEERTWLETIIFGAVVIVCGMSVLFCGSEASFSYGIMGIQLLLVCVSLCIVPRQDKLTGIAMASVYFIFAALLYYLLLFLITYSGRDSDKLEILICLNVLSFGLCNQLKKVEVELKENISAYKGTLCLIAFEGMVVLRVCQVIFDEFTGNYLQETTSAAIVLALMAVVLFWAFELFLQNLKTMDELRFSDVKEKALEENYHNLSQIMEENQENMHDLKHHVQALKLFSEHDDIDGIRGYLEKMGESVFKTDQLAWTDSKILNTVLNQKQEECKKLGIHMDIHVGHSFQLPLDSREICTVFCNLLDNATEACERIDADKRWIQVELRRQGEMAFIIVENSISETPKIKNGRLVSSKADEKAHGIGLRSVKRTVKRHGGEMQIEIMEDMFRISLTFFEM